MHIDIDIDSFFRQASMKILGESEIEQSLYQLLCYLHEFMPVGRICVQYICKNYSSVRIIACATQQEAKRVDLLLPLSRGAFNKDLQPSNYPSDLKVMPANERLVDREIQDQLQQDYQYIALLLLGFPDYIGSAVFLTTDPQGFSDTQQQLIHALKAPLSMALAHAKQRLELEEMKVLIAEERSRWQACKHPEYTAPVGAELGLREILEQAARVAPMESPVLLLGETGTGKDVLAHYIHHMSNRRDGPFVSVNCGAIPENLVDAELFGYEKGAFTGAVKQHKGRFERAHQGTIFLDEVGELPLAVQVKLLRVLQNKEIERIGGNKSIPVDIRVIAATNRCLEIMIQQAQFRKDLWFRLNVFPITLPPLRERLSDLPELVRYFVQVKAAELKLSKVPKIAEHAVEPLFDYPWPGNVRELQNIVERALILNPQGPLSFNHLIALSNNDSLPTKAEEMATEKLDDVVTAHIHKILHRTSGKIHGEGGAAQRLGINPSTLRNRMEKLGIDYKKKD